MALSSRIAPVDAVTHSSRLGELPRPDLRVVALGGGTGLPTVLRGLRPLLFASRPLDPERDQTRLTATLCAELSDGTVIEGESRIAGARSPIRRLRLHPSDASAPPEALHALEWADLIVIGPGSLYSSLVAVLLAGELPEAIARSRARVVLVMNLMTEP